MKQRLLIAFGVLALLFFLPGLPPVRNALLHWGESLAARAGYTVSYSSSSGNLLYRVGLQNLSVTGPGVDVTAKSAELGYTLPALITGKLPLRTDVTGVRGRVEINKLAPPASATPPPNAAPAQRRVWVRPVLEQANLTDVALNISGAPFDVPDAKLTRLELQEDGDAFDFRTALAVNKAVVEADGTVTLDPFKVKATVQRADVALAQSYFEGLQGGVITGKVQADAQGVTGNLKLQNGKIDLVGLELRQVSGPLTVKNQKLKAELTGRALGGPLKGTGTVDLGARRWQADVTGNAGLRDALTWLGRDQLPESVVEVLGPSGSAAVDLTVGGWQTFTLSGQANGRGRLLGEPLRKLEVDFGFKSAVGTDVRATATLGGAPFRFALTPQQQGQGFTLTADGKNLPLQKLGQNTTADVTVALTSQQGTLTGTTDLTLDTQVLGRSATFTANAKKNPQAWQVELSGQDALGAELTGGFGLKGNVLDGRAQATQLTLPGLADPVTVTARADGPISDLPLALRVTGPDGVHPAGSGVRADANFAGKAAATLKNGTLTGIKGDFGPLNLSGTLNDLRYALSPTALSGRVQGSVAVKNGRLNGSQGKQPGQLSATAQLVTKNLRGAGVTLPDLNATVKLAQQGGLTASVKDNKAGVDVSLQHGELTGALGGTRIGALGETFAATGTVKGRAAQLSKSLELDLQAETTGNGPGTTLGATGNAQNTKLSVQGEKGATLAGRKLGKPLTLSGNASLTEQKAELSGKLGGVGVSVTAKPDASGKLRTQAELSSGGQAFTARFDSLASWATDGTLPLSELGQALGLPLRGTVQTTLARQGNEFSGQATVQGEAFGLPLEAQAQSRGDKLTLGASSNVLGQPLTLSGTALPKTDATLQFGDYGAVQVRGRYPALRVQGSGQVPGVSKAGLTLTAQPWQLRGNLAQGRATLNVGASQLTATRGKNGWALSAGLEQTATLRGQPLRLSADLTRTPQNPAGRVRGTLSLGSAPVKLGGTLKTLTLTGNVPAKTLQPGLLGTLELNAQVDALTQAYKVRSSWRYDERNNQEVLKLNATGQRAKVTASVQGNGLDVRFDTQTGQPSWTVRAEGVALNTLPVEALQNALQNLDAQLEGTLGSSPKGYSGTLNLTAGDATAQLRGRGERLGFTATFARGALQANATGTLLPELGVTLAAKAADAATFQGAVRGSLAQPRLSGQLKTAAQNLGGQFTLPARAFELGASLRNGLTASLTGDGANVRLENGAWNGTVTLPFTLRGEPHRLTGTLQGALAEPVLNADLKGKIVEGPLTLSRSGLNGKVEVTPNLSALPDADIQATITASPDLSWRTELTGSATLPYRKLPVALTGAVTGRSTSYDGTATLTVAGAQVPLTVSGKAGQVQAKAEFDAVELSAFAPVQGTLSGDVRVTTGTDGLRYFADLNTQGTAAGRAFDLALSADRGTGLGLTGTVAGASVSAEGKLPLETLNVRVADSEVPLELRAQLGLGQSLSVRGEGAWQGQALTFQSAYTPAQGGGTLRAALGDAQLTGTVTRTEAGRTLDATLAAPTGVLGTKTPLGASLQASQTGQTLEVTALNARFGANKLSLLGTVPGRGDPQAALTGTLSVPAAGAPIALRLSALETGYLASLTQNDLILRGVLSPGFRPERVRLLGTLERPTLALQSDLVWQLGAGFSGRADATFEQQNVDRRGGTGTLTLIGQEQLKLMGTAGYRGVQVATLAATLSAEPWRDQTVSGTLGVSAPAQELSPVWPGDPLTVAGELALSGTLTAPQLEGPLSLRGALSADGTLQATRQGAKLSLKGDGLRGVASANAKGYRTTLTLTQLGLGQLLSLGSTKNPTLSGALRATGRWGAAPNAQSDLEFVSGQSRVTSRVRFQDGLSGTVTLGVRLQDVVSGWQGRVEGPIYLTGAAANSSANLPLSGTLSLQNIGPKAADWRLSGDLGLSGSVPDPTVTAALRGQGSADGTLQATLTPRRGQLELTSTLALLGAETDLTLTRTRASLSAAGTLQYGDFRTELTTQGGRVQLQGGGKLAGWRGVYGPQQLSLSGPLNSLNPQLKGKLALTGTADLETLSGTLTQAAFGPVSLGEVAFRRQANALEFSGDALEAQLGLAGTLPWTLTKLKLTGPGSSTLTLSGQGTRTQGRVAGTVTAASLALPLTARYGAAGLALSAQGALPIGTLDLQARYRERWRGQVNVTQKTAEGQTQVSSRLSGTLTTPKLAGDLELTQNGNAVEGTFAVGREVLALDAQVTSPQLSAPVSVKANGWPLALTFSTPQLSTQTAGNANGTQNALQNTLKLALQGGRLEPSGALTLGVGPAQLTLRAGEAGDRKLVLEASAPAAPGLMLRTVLPAALGDYAALTKGVTFQGAEELSGSLVFKAQPTPQLTAQTLRWQTPAGTLTLAGTGTLAGSLSSLEADLTGRWSGSKTAPVPWLRNAVPFHVRAASGQLTLTSAELGQLSARYDLSNDPGAGRFAFQSNLTLGSGTLLANASYTRADGPTGTLELRSVPVFSVGQEVGTLSSELALSPADVSGDGTLALAGGKLSISGAAGWARLLPEALGRLTPAGTGALNAQLRLSRFNLGDVPQISARLPYLSAPVSGVATFSGTQIVGQLIAPELKVLANKLPTQVDFNGTLTSLEARATVADSRFNVRYSRAKAGTEEGGPSLSGLVTLESFPLQALPEAFVGASQVKAAVTGAARFELPLRRPTTGYVRLATERLTLQNTGPDSSGKATQGDVALRFENGRLYVERAEFRGDGFWRAQGVLTPENLDFTLEAQNANFTPLLRLAPPLAALNVGAQGSLDLRASGSASAPDITLSSPRLALQVAGTRYRAVGTTASLSGGAFGLKGALLGVAPIQGRLELSGSGQLNLAPFATNALALRFSGDAAVPTLGRVTQIQGRITPSETGLQLSSEGVLGRPFRVSGSLTPLDLELKGQDLDVQARRLFVASSSTDVDLTLKSGGGGLTLAGSAFVNRAQLSLNRSEETPTPGAPTGSAEPPASSPAPAQTPPPATDASPDAPSNVAPVAPDLLGSTASAAAVTDPAAAQGTVLSTLDSVAASTGTASTSAASDSAAPNSVSSTDPTADLLITTPAAVPSDASRAANPVLERIRFDGVTLQAPREVLFNEAFGSAELSLDVTLSGTAAQPRLEGQAQTLGGSVRFSGQDFSLTLATATFDPARGVYPTLALGATASFDKGRALGGVPATQTAQPPVLVEPPGPSFEVNLQITGGFEESASGRRVLDLSPTLSSNAELQENGGNPQPLTEPELVSLLTLGRLQLDTAVGGANSLAGTVAESALDTAVDLLVVSELQNALNDVLGTDILEIRTSAFSSILGTEGGQKNFGVSVKVGGYLSDNLFASVQVGRFDDPEQAYALSNEFLLRYTAAPLELSLSGGVNFSDRLGSLSAATDFSLGLSYAITPLISLDASLDTTALNTSLDPAARGRNTSVGFGVSFIW